jgi:hypothetical protein
MQTDGMANAMLDLDAEGEDDVDVDIYSRR